MKWPASRVLAAFSFLPIVATILQIQVMRVSAQQPGSASRPQTPQSLAQQRPPIALTTRPGGISLTKAAAERLRLNFSLDGAYIEQGRLVLSGRDGSRGSIDAALFLSGLRAACENSDPYFSLDPDDFTAWLAASGQAKTELGDTLKSEFAWKLRTDASRSTPSILAFRTISASHDFPAIWKSILTRHPELKSRLVFSPEWLRETRLGEIMYNADVLLKELAGGATALGVAKFRASDVEGYRSATERMAAMNLLERYNGQTEQRTVAGGRIWYDLTGPQMLRKLQERNPWKLIPSFGAFWEDEAS